MTRFQAIGLGISVGMTALTALAMARRGGRRLALGPWLLLWAGAAAAFAVPDAMTRLAKLVGIGRGADVVLYCAVLGGIAIAFRLTMAQRRLERQLTGLVRELAIERALATDAPAKPVATAADAAPAEAP
jgi:small membrane protein